MLKNNIYINELFEPDSTFIGNRVCKNGDCQCIELSSTTIYRLVTDPMEIKNCNFRCMLKGKNANDYENLLRTESDPTLKRIYLYLTFALKRLENETIYNRSSLIADINEVLIAKDKYIDTLYPEHRHYM